MATSGSAVIFNDGKFQGIGQDGKVVPYGELYFQKCCTGEPMTTFRDSVMSSRNTYPIILSASGKADVFILDAEYDVILKDRHGVTVWTISKFIPTSGDGSTLLPAYQSSYRDEQAGKTGTTQVLNFIPLTDIEVHKNGELLYSTEYSVQNKYVTFIKPLVSSDKLIYNYITIPDTAPVGVVVDVDVIDNKGDATLTQLLDPLLSKDVTVIVKETGRGGTLFMMPMQVLMTMVLCSING